MVEVYSPGLATFSVHFLGCKVSHVDAHAVRERLLADGHRECGDGAEVAVVNTCCVTNEALAKSRKEAARHLRHSSLEKGPVHGFRSMGCPHV